MSSPMLPHDGFTSLHWRSVIRMAYYNLRFKRFRTFITILGVTIGIGSIYLLISFGVGVQQLVEAQIVGNKSIDTIDITSTNSDIVTLNKDSTEQLQAINHVTEVSGIFSAASRVTLGGSTSDVVAYGIDRTYMSLTSFTLVSGERLNPDESTQAMVNESLLRVMGVSDTKSAVGKNLSIDIPSSDGTPQQYSVRITGVIDSGDTPEIFTSSKLFEKAGVTTYSLVKAVVDERDSIAQVRYQIEGFGYETTSPVDTLDQINQVFHFFNIILISLGSIGMIIAALGMVNTLTVSLLERTREVALMMIIGGRPKDMRRLFTVEAVLISLTGGVAGVILASIASGIINMVLNQLARTRGAEESFSVFSVSPVIILATLALMVVIGILVSIVPSRRAARINPVEALREE